MGDCFFSAVSKFMISLINEPCSLERHHRAIGTSVEIDLHLFKFDLARHDPYISQIYVQRTACTFVSNTVYSQTEF